MGLAFFKKGSLLKLCGFFFFFPEEIGNLSLFLLFSPEKRRFRTHLIHSFVDNWFLVAFQKGFLVACQQSFTP